MPIDKATLTLPGIAHAVELYTLQQAAGLRARILTLGGAVMTLEVPDETGRLADVVLGFDEPAGYLDNRPFLGALIGRYGNRIARGELPIDDHVFALAKNDGPNHLHGGPGGFHTVPWEVSAIGDGAEPSLALRYVSRDGEEGYPGTVVVEAVYTLTGDRALRVDYTARTDRADGREPDPALVLQPRRPWGRKHPRPRAAAVGVALSPDRSPTGSRRARRVRCAGRRSISWSARRSARACRAQADDEQLRNGHGYDHCFAVDGWDGSLRTIAELVEPASRRRMLVRTTEPGLQLYVGTHLGGIAGKRGARYDAHTGICLEAQRFPDSPHHPEFPSTRLEPGETYRQTTEYVFPLA